jgi:hypothetical protein
MTVRDRQYAELVPSERAALIVRAVGRDDYSERDRLWATCRHITVRDVDPAVTAKLDALRSVATTAAGLLAVAFDRLDYAAGLRAPIVGESTFADLLCASAEEALLDGYGRGLRDGLESMEEFDTRWDLARWDEAQLAGSEHARRVGRMVNALIDGMETNAANRAASVLAALETWAHGAGVDAGELLAAEFPLFGEVLSDHRALVEAASPDEQFVAVVLDGFERSFRRS